MATNRKNYRHRILWCYDKFDSPSGRMARYWHESGAAETEVEASERFLAIVRYCEQFYPEAKVFWYTGKGRVHHDNNGILSSKHELVKKIDLSL